MDRWAVNIHSTNGDTLKVTKYKMGRESECICKTGNASHNNWDLQKWKCTSIVQMLYNLDGGAEKLYVLLFWLKCQMKSKLDMLGLIIKYKLLTGRKFIFVAKNEEGMKGSTKFGKRIFEN